MKNKDFKKSLLIILLLILTGCGRNDEETVYDGETTSEASETDSEELLDVFSEADSEELSDAFSEADSGELLDAFLASEIPAIEEGGMITFDQLPVDAEDFNSYSIGARIDLDNDGEKEQVVNGPYGGIYFDARDGKVYVLARGEGTAGELFYTKYDNAAWIVHCDVTHVGRQMYWLTKYDGGGNIVDEFQLSAEYWDSPDDKYVENSDFTYRDEKISMGEFEALREEILGNARYMD